jgi:hypothetical protein
MHFAMSGGIKHALVETHEDVLSNQTLQKGRPELVQPEAVVIQFRPLGTYL